MNMFCKLLGHKWVETRGPSMYCERGCGAKTYVPSRPDIPCLNDCTVRMSSVQDVHGNDFNYAQSNPPLMKNDHEHDIKMTDDQPSFSYCRTCGEIEPEPQNIADEDSANGYDIRQRSRDEHFVELARVISTRSKDPSTKTGAVIVDQSGRIVSTGYNGFPQKMPDNESMYADRKVKYSRIVHCEMNALIFAHRDLSGCTLYTWPFLSCDRCVVHMLQAGIVRFVAPKCPEEKKVQWEPIFEMTRRYIRECNARYEEI